MHQLNRGPMPNCLSGYQHGRDNWDHVSADDKALIREDLSRMQGRYCAYCECEIKPGDGHIEHFRQKGRFPQGTFDWSNLFASCSHQDSCGIYKDRCGDYDHSVLIKPDVEDPEKFFLFASNGSIVIRLEKLSPPEVHRAKETLRILNLDPEFGRLRQMRQSAARPYKVISEEIRQIAEAWPNEDWPSFLQKELELAKDSPFFTTIKHFLTPQAV